MKRIAITACPYSGTKFTKTLLCKYGLDIGHEIYGADGIVSWTHAHLSKRDFIADGFYENMKLLHQVAHPLMVISRLRALHNGSTHPDCHQSIWEMIIERTEYMGLPWDIAADVQPSPKDEALLPWMKLWYWWNKHCSEKADHTYRVEGIKHHWRSFRWACGLGDVEYIETKKTVNRKKTSVIKSWNDLYDEDAELTMAILELAGKFGYEQIPTGYIGDPFYVFPDVVSLT